MLLLIQQSLMEMVGTDGQAEEGRLVFEVLAVEAGLLSATSKLEKPIRKKPPFLGWVGHGPSRGWNQYWYRLTNYSES